jgi:hypothetical protein
MRALSFTPERLIKVNIIRTKRAPTKVGNGRVTSPARYEAAVAADTTDVDAKSSKRSAAPTRANDFVDTLRLLKHELQNIPGINRLTYKCTELH